MHLFDTAADFHAWLEANHASAGELWVGYYRKGVAKDAMSYPEAVEEALCYGWIDGIIYRINDEVTASRFTPRRQGSVWSSANLERVKALRAAGRMRPSGLAVFEQRDRSRDEPNLRRGLPVELPADSRARLRRDTAAWAYWQASTPSYRRNAVAWIYAAKRPETRERRLATLIADSAAQRRIKPLSYGREDR